MTGPTFPMQPTLENEFVKIRPVTEADFDTLYQVASDPLIWEQHPNKNRYQKEAFQNFFKGALTSKGAFIVMDAKDDRVIGSSRYCDSGYNTSDCIGIGYTFFARSHWGGVYNPALKQLMTDYAFQFVDRIVFHIGAVNIRSQKSIEKIGAIKIDEIALEYYGEPSQPNFVYEMKKPAATNQY